MLSTDELRSLKSRAVRMAAKDGEYGLNSPAFMYWLVRLAIDDEREACAQLALQGTGEAVQTKTLEILQSERQRIADAIRERGEK